MTNTEWDAIVWRELGHAAIMEHETNLTAFEHMEFRVGDRKFTAAEIHQAYCQERDLLILQASKRAHDLHYQYGMNHAEILADLKLDKSPIQFFLGHVRYPITSYGRPGRPRRLLSEETV